MIKCPETLKAGPFHFQILRDGSNGAYGVTNSVNQTITFGYASMPKPTQAFVTLVHEWFHVIQETNSLDGSDKQLTHDQIQVFACGLTDLLQQLGIDTTLDVAGLPEK